VRTANKKRNTHRSAEVSATMGAVANDAQRSLIALLLAVELATLLGRHVFTSRCVYASWWGLSRYGRELAEHGERKTA